LAIGGKQVRGERAFGRMAWPWEPGQLLNSGLENKGRGGGRGKLGGRSSSGVLLGSRGGGTTLKMVSNKKITVSDKQN